MKAKVLLSSILLAILLSIPAQASGRNEMSFGADWVKLDKGVWLGAHCLIATGETEKLLDSLTSGLAGGIIKWINILDKAIDKITLEQGDAYCVYMLRTERAGRNFDRPELIEGNLRGFTRSDQFKRLPSIWHIATFDGGDKAARRHSNKCWNAKKDGPRSRCLTEVLDGSADGKANEKTKGGAACFQVELSAGKVKSAVIAWGTVPAKLRMETDEAIVKDVPCRDREADFMG